MRLKFLIFVLGIIQLSLSAQNLTLKEVQQDIFVRKMSSTRAGVETPMSANTQIAQLPVPPGERVGEVYFADAWQKSIVALYGSEKELEGFLAKYELRSNAIEFKVKNDVKVLDVKRVKTLVLLDSLDNVPHFFVNGKEYTHDNVQLTSLLEVLSQGKISLYKQPTYWISKPDYNVALNVGSKDERLFKKENFYFSNQKELTPVPTKKKGLPAVFGDKAPEVEKFIKANDLGLSKERDLIKIFDYYNTLP